MDNKNKLLLGSILGLCSSALIVAPGAFAAGFTVTSQLLGDARQVAGANPDGLVVDVTIDVNDLMTSALWTIDINSPLHPDIKLDEFYFNLAGQASDFSFSGFNPTGWEIKTPASVQGAGGTTFSFEALDPSGPPNAADVTNSQNLTFIMNYTGIITSDLFTNALTAISNDAGSGQLGAHLQSLSQDFQVCPNGCNTDSGFAFGNYGVDQGPPVGVPEPSTILGSLAMLGMCGYLGHRKKQQAKQKVA